MREKAVRDWVRKVWAGRPITWAEPGRGATFGLADLYLPISPLLLAVELKAFDETETGYLLGVAVRPAQVVYHHQLGSAGIKSAFMFGVKGTDKKIRCVDSIHVVRAMMNEKPADRVVDKNCCIVLTDHWMVNESFIRSNIIRECGLRTNHSTF